MTPLGVGPGAGPGVGAGIGSVAGPAAGGPATAQGDAAKLRGAARQLTGVFAQQLFKAMRATVPQGEGVFSGGSGEEMFTGMLDEHLAGAAPGRPGAAERDGPGAAWTRALADAVFRRMRPGAAGETGTAGETGAPAPTGALVTPGPARASLDRPDALAITAAPAGRR